MEKRIVDLAKYRLQRGKEMLKDAEMLLAHGSYKSALNRTYYAVFHAARALLATKELDSRKHKGVVSLFNKHFVKTGLMDKRFSKILSEAKDLREDSDYDDFYLIDEEEVKKDFQNCKDFIKEVERVVPELLESK